MPAWKRRSMPGRSIHVGKASGGRSFKRWTNTTRPSARDVERRWFANVLLFDGRVVFAETEVLAQHAQTLPQMDNSLRVDLRNARLRNAQGRLDFFEGLPLEVVELDHRALLRGQILDRRNQFVANLALLDRASHLGFVGAQRVEQRNIL